MKTETIFVPARPEPPVITEVALVINGSTGVTTITIASIDQAEKIVRNAEAVRAQTFIEEGMALRWIRDGRHYIGRGFDSFESYMQGVFGLSRQSGYNYIAAAETAMRVNTSLQPDSPPPSLHQALEISKAEPEQQKQIAETTDFSNTPVRKLRAKVKAVKKATPAKTTPKVGAKPVAPVVNEEVTEFGLVQGTKEEIADYVARQHAFYKAERKENSATVEKELLKPFKLKRWEHLLERASVAAIVINRSLDGKVTWEIEHHEDVLTRDQRTYVNDQIQGKHPIIKAPKFAR